MLLIAGCSSSSSYTDSPETTDPSPSENAMLGDYVWIDSDINGIQDGEEAGRPGAIVELYNSMDNLISSTTSDANLMVIIYFLI